MATTTSHVRSEQRYTKSRRCPICGGCDRDQRGKGRRCHGFISGDYAHCSREEHSGALSPSDGGTFGHKLRGPCKCGSMHSGDSWGDDIECAYDYRDERGTLLYQVVRKFPKAFAQRKPDGAGGWDWKTAGTRRVLYRLPELLASDRNALVYIVEGEKDVDALRAKGAIATCNPMGAGKWAAVDECARAALRGRHVVVIPDDDAPGRDHATTVAMAAATVAATVRTLTLPNKDVSDWLDAGGTIEALADMASSIEATSTSEAPSPVPFVRAPDLKSALVESAKLPWVELRLDAEGIALVRGPVGAYCVLVGWEGSGKSSIVMQLGIAAARAGLAFVYMITELDDAETAARVVGIQTGHTWEDAHRGRVPETDRDAALEMPGFVVLSGERATLANLEQTVEALRAEDPNRTIVVAWDYLQDLDLDARDERAKVSAASRMLRRAAKRLRTFSIAVSQTSRAGREDLRSGDAIGADTATKGAESSQIERDAYVMLALGNPREQPDGTILMDLSVGKGRMRAGNQVYPLVYEGRTGRSHIAGDARSAAEVRQERRNEKSTKYRETLARAILALVEKSPEPMSKADITSRTEGNNAAIGDTIKALIRSGELAHDFTTKKGGHPLIWTPAQLAARQGSES